MSFLNKAKKEDLIQLAAEFAVEVSGEMLKAQIIKAITEHSGYEEGTAKDYWESIYEDRIEREQAEKLAAEAREERERQERLAAETRKHEADMAREREARAHQHEMEMLRLRLEARQEAGNSASEDGSIVEVPTGNRTRSIDELIKAIKLLTLRVPTRAEGWNVFFQSLEKAFASEEVPETQKAKILCSLLGEKTANLFTYLESEQYNDYAAVKEVVLNEFQPSTKTCLENFRRAKRAGDENFVQFATRLAANWSYYCQRREAEDLKTVNDLIVADKLMSCLDGDTAAYVSLKQGESWLRPRELAQECDRYFAAKGRGYGFTPRSEPPARAKEQGKPPVEIKKEFSKAKNTGCYGCGATDHFRRDCPKIKRDPKHKEGERTTAAKTLKQTPEGSDRSPEDRRVVARVDALRARPDIPARAKLQRAWVWVDGRKTNALLDSGCEMAVINRSRIGQIPRDAATIGLRPAFGPIQICPLVKIRITGDESGLPTLCPIEIMCAAATDMQDEMLLPPEIFSQLQGRESRGVNLAVEARAQEMEVEESGNGIGSDTRPEGTVSTGDRRENEPEGETEAEIRVSETPEEGESRGEKSPTNADQKETPDDLFLRDQEKCTALQRFWEWGKQNKGGYFIAGRFLYHRDKILGEEFGQLVLPENRREEVLKLGHESVFSGHLGTKKTIERIRYSFFWDTMRGDIERFCKTCPGCQLRKPTKVSDRAPITPVARPELPFQVINVDLIGPLEPASSKGHRYILCMVDQHTRWAEAVPLGSLNARSTCDALLGIFARTGIPNVIASDNGTNFNSELTKEFERRLGASPRFSTPAYPESNGLVERFNQTLKAMLHFVVREEGRKWHLQLPYVLWAYREIPNATTGVSPFQLLYGRPAQGPLYILKSTWTGETKGAQYCTKTVPQYLQELKARLERAAEQAQVTSQIQQERMASHYNLRSKRRQFKEGDQVVVLVPDSTNKLYARWQGPATIEKEIRPHSFIVRMGDGSTKHVHQNKIREYLVRASAVNLILEGEEEFGEVLPIPSENRDGEELGESVETLTTAHLQETQAKRLRGILDKFKEVFTRQFQPAEVGKHRIELLPGVERRKPHCYGVPMAYRAEVDRQVKELLHLGLVEPAEAEIAHPVVCVAKKDATTRLCVDYRALNGASRVPSFPMKDIQEMIFEAGKAKWLTSLDLKRGYWQIRMDEESKGLTAFRTHTGTFQWTVMPFGLVGASGTFQREMNKALRGCNKFAQAYIDDVIIFSSSFEEHLTHLQTVLEILDRKKFSLRLDKCKFAMEQLEYLGHKIGGGKHGPCDAKIDAIRNLAPPTTKKGVRSVLGLMGFYRAYIPNFAEIAGPLTSLTQKCRPLKVVWGEAEENAFRKLQRALCEATRLSTPDLSLPFQIHSDASDLAVGGCLTQRDEQGNFRPIAFVSKKFSDTQKRWATIEKEAWGVLFALTKFEKWVLGGSVEVITDHNPLKFLNATTPKSPKLTRWALALQRWDVKITHMPGASHVAADALSRLERTE